MTRVCIETGKQLLNNRHVDSELLQKFSKNASILGCLPGVPSLTDVPLITLQIDANVENELLKTCSNLGTIYHTPPVQVLDCLILTLFNCFLC